VDANLLSLPYIQIIADILFFVAIFFLLHQLNKKIKQRSPMIDASAVSELKKLIGNSESITNQFTTSMEDGKQQINKLIKQLDDKERKLVMLLVEAETTLQNFSVQKTKLEPDIKYNQYDEVIKMVRQGLSLEEIAKRSGVTEGEITLVMEFAKNRET
jgi:DNA-binding NarL/FixJ family response regulator